MKTSSCISVFVALAAVLAVSFFGLYNWILRLNEDESSDIYNGADSDNSVLFNLYDANDDGYLSLEEFKPIANRINFVNETFKYNDSIETGDEVITLQSFFQPLLISTMRKDMNEWGALGSLPGLQSWTHPSKTWKNYGASHFRSLLPSDTSANNLCEPYYLVNPPKTTFGPATLSSKRHYSPELQTDAEILIHRLLAMLHPRPFVNSRFAPQGSIACIRAFNQHYLDIVFRIHAEFQLNEPPLYPFWFTPAQFTGHLIIDREATTVKEFDLFVPTHNRLNVDMEWLTGTSEANMEVDIGYMPQMALQSTRPSLPAMHDAQDQRETFHQNIDAPATNIKWDKEVTFEEAASRLEVEMYPFKQVKYYNFTDVFPVAARHQKPVHSIMLWGALDDQSC